MTTHSNITPDFDEIIERRGTHSAKWDLMEQLFGVPTKTGLSMWVADMDFRPPQCISDAIKTMHTHGIYGYYGNDAPYRAAINWWMENRHGWHVEPEWIFTTHGLVNGTAMCVDTYTDPGDGIVLFTPVYHAFAKVINANDRRVIECPLVNNDGRYEMDFAAYDAQMDGSAKMVVLCSPHNPGGRVWTRDELQGVADFAKRHDLILVSDEIHHDLVFDGVKHTIMALVDDTITDRLIMMTAATKTFNIAGCHAGNVIIPDADLRAKFTKRMLGLGLSPNSFGIAMTEAAYSPEGAAWVDALVDYIDGNKTLFEAGINAIPGVKAMPLEATYLEWVDFSDTGMTPEEFTKRVEKDAEIAVNYGHVFGLGGDDFLRFNIAMPREHVVEAVERLHKVFGDLQ